MQINQRLARLIDLVPYISSHQGIAIADLAERFGVAVPEIEKDLWLLYCCGLPGQTPLELMEFAFEDGYVYVRNADELKSPRSFSQVEIATLVMGLEIIANEGNDLAKDLAARLRAKLAAQILIQPNLEVKFVKELNQAIQDNLLVEIQYKGVIREIIPFEVYSERQSTYLKAFCRKANARRTFKLDRIESLKLTGYKVIAPNDVSSLDKMRSTPIKVHREARRVRESFAISGPLNHEKVIGDLSYYSTEWLLREVMALGGSVELLEADLRQELVARATAGKNLYLG